MREFYLLKSFAWKLDFKCKAEHRPCSEEIILDAELLASPVHQHLAELGWGVQETPAWESVLLGKEQEC